MPVILLLGLAFGVGLGYCVQRAGLCFAHGLGEIYIGRGRRIFRLFIVIFAISGTGFLLSGYLSENLGLKEVGQLRGYGLYNIIAGLFFGTGISLNGGCILGTLRQIGEGNSLFMIVLLSFIPGMALTVHIIDPLLEGSYNSDGVLLPDLLGVPAPLVTAALVAAALLWYILLSRKKSKSATE
jgi:uncharacterized membrane protein YedE/YeeE